MRCILRKCNWRPSAREQVPAGYETILGEAHDHLAQRLPNVQKEL